MRLLGQISEWNDIVNVIFDITFSRQHAVLQPERSHIVQDRFHGRQKQVVQTHNRGGRICHSRQLNRLGISNDYTVLVDDLNITQLTIRTLLSTFCLGLAHSAATVTSIQKYRLESFFRDLSATLF